MQKLAASALVVLFAAPLFGCANVVLLPGETDATSGVGGGDTSGSTASGATTTQSGWDGCPSQCEGSSGASTCACAVSCSGLSKIACAPIIDLQGNSKIECVCTFEEQFSGVCYETKPEATCDPHAGCCFKYFQSTQ